ncbi:unnamed protein product [Cylicostephanus goldi]|uniref:4Fe-4S ferredoxin-type domain-containing protein n=1 Tax=Cylicostephanus goldi TaxID=71465 RepID=A0A3P7M523_CYLGO|nr:unnamed protein product [Cylicostephanus goldi]
MKSSLIFLFSALLISAAVAAKLGKREAEQERQKPQEVEATPDSCDCSLKCPSELQQGKPLDLKDQKSQEVEATDSCDCSLKCPSESQEKPLGLVQGSAPLPAQQQVPEEAANEDVNLGYMLN